jgi:hypothetical protein
VHLVDRPEFPPVWALASFMTILAEGASASLAWLYDVTALHDAKLAAERAMAADRSSGNAPCARTNVRSGSASARKIIL